ncbi:hypothetical protein PN836_018890 [Ningiella sp. W23]|uniref:hypothetical protein n=1 Tax=Ningiella sp. W23 TaxID=3023715 RepID=UPI00375735AB
MFRLPIILLSLIFLIAASGKSDARGASSMALDSNDIRSNGNGDWGSAALHESAIRSATDQGVNNLDSWTSEQQREHIENGGAVDYNARAAAGLSTEADAFTGAGLSQSDFGSCGTCGGDDNSWPSGNVNTGSFVSPETFSFNIKTSTPPESFNDFDAAFETSRTIIESRHNSGAIADAVEDDLVRQTEEALSNATSGFDIFGYANSLVDAARDIAQNIAERTLAAAGPHVKAWQAGSSFSAGATDTLESLRRFTRGAALSYDSQNRQRIDAGLDPITEVIPRGIIDWAVRTGNLPPEFRQLYDYTLDRFEVFETNDLQHHETARMLDELWGNGLIDIALPGNANAGPFQADIESFYEGVELTDQQRRALNHSIVIKGSPAFIQGLRNRTQRWERPNGAFVFPNFEAVGDPFAAGGLAFVPERGILDETEHQNTVQEEFQHAFNFTIGEYATAAVEAHERGTRRLDAFSGELERAQTLAALHESMEARERLIETPLVGGNFGVEYHTQIIEGVAKTQILSREDHIADVLNTTTLSYEDAVTLTDQIREASAEYIEVINLGALEFTEERFQEISDAHSQN